MTANIVFFPCSSRLSSSLDARLFDSRNLRTLLFRLHKTNENARTKPRGARCLCRRGGFESNFFPCPAPQPRALSARFIMSPDDVRHSPAARLTRADPNHISEAVFRGFSAPFPARARPFRISGVRCIGAFAVCARRPAGSRESDDKGFSCSLPSQRRFSAPPMTVA